MLGEPHVKRTVALFDGQNLFRHAKAAFGHHHPNCGPMRLATDICATRGWTLAGVRFCTGVPSVEESSMWHGYWSRRLTAMSRVGIAVTSRPLRYRTRDIRREDGTVDTVSLAQEKGIRHESCRASLDDAWCDLHDCTAVASDDGDPAGAMRLVKNIIRRNASV